MMNIMKLLKIELWHTPMAVIRETGYAAIDKYVLQDVFRRNYLPVCRRVVRPILNTILQEVETR